MTMRHPIAAVVLAAVALAACGGGDDADDGAGSTVDAPATATSTATATSADPTSPATEVTEPSDGSSSDVAPTIPADVPEAFLPGIGPIAVEGESLPQLPEGGDDPAVGTAAPALVGEDFDGNAVRVDPAVDGPTWIVFLAHWCPHCNDEIPVINELRDGGRLPEGVHIVGVSTAVNPDRPNFPPGEWLVDKDWTFDVLADGIDIENETFVAAEAYGVSGFPFSVLVDGDGNVVERWSGGRPADDLVAKLTGGFALAG